jgi:hypothetical protein
LCLKAFFTEQLGFTFKNSLAWPEHLGPPS